MASFSSSSRLCLLCLVLALFLAIQAMAENSESKASPTQLDTQRSHGLAGGEAESPFSGESDGNEDAEAEAPSIRRLAKHRSDKSVAGGGVIIGGLVTAIFAAVFCYIRVTRKRNSVL